MSTTIASPLGKRTSEEAGLTPSPPKYRKLNTSRPLALYPKPNPAAPLPPFATAPSEPLPAEHQAALDRVKRTCMVVFDAPITTTKVYSRQGVASLWRPFSNTRYENVVAAVSVWSRDEKTLRLFCTVHLDGVDGGVTLSLQGCMHPASAWGWFWGSPREAEEGELGGLE